MKKKFKFCYTVYKGAYRATIYVCAKTLSTTFDIFNWHLFMYSAFSSLRKQSGVTYLAFLYWLCNMFMVAIKISGRHLLTYKWKYKIQWWEHQLKHENILIQMMYTLTIYVYSSRFPNIYFLHLSTPTPPPPHFFLKWKHSWSRQ